MFILCYDFVLGFKYVVFVESGLGREKGFEILLFFVNMKKEDLLAEVYSIIKECKGSVVWVWGVVGTLTFWCKVG